MAAASIIPISENRARVGKTHPKNVHGLSLTRGVGLDYFSNPSARTGWGTPSLTEGTQYDLVRLSYNYPLVYSLYRNHWICRRIVDAPADDMVKAWPRLTSEIDPEDLTTIDRKIRNTQTKLKIRETLHWARLFGGAGALIVIDGQENELDKPLDFDKIEIGAYKGLIPFDMWSGIQPMREISTDFTKPKEFNRPEYYRVHAPNGTGGFDVHASRILPFYGPIVPTPELQAQMYWGISVLEPCFEEIRKRDNMSWNILSLTYRANLISMRFPDLAQMLSGASMSQAALMQFQGRMQGVNELMSNQNLLLLPKDGEMSSVNYGFAGVSDVYQQFQLDIAGASQIPVTRLYGRTISGLGQANEADERIYEQFISQEQSSQMEPQFDTLYRVICMSELGEVPEDLDLEFPSVRVLDEKEKADLAKAVGDNIVSLFGAGIITKPQALKELKQSSDITGIGTNITDEDIGEAEEQQALLPELPGEGGEEGAEPGAGGEKGAKSPGALVHGARSNAYSQGPQEEQSTETHPKAVAESKRKALRKAFGDSIATDSWDNFIELEFAGLPITVEFSAGERRLITNADDEIVYDRVMQWPYGFIQNTIGQDHDEIDVILGPVEASPTVFVVNMMDYGPDYEQRENEHKVCLGFLDRQSAIDAFCTMYPEDFYGGLEEVPLGHFPEWLRIHTRAEARAMDAFKEAEHPRERSGEKGGQFTTGSGGGAAGTRPKSKQPGQQPESGIQPGSGKSHQIVLRAVKQRAFKGEPVQTKTPISKLEAGQIGEQIVMQFLRDQGLKDARPAETGRNNYPIDVVADHKGIEVKTGLVSNGPTAQHWRATIGQPGKAEQKWLKKASPEAKRAMNEAKAERIIKRKEKACVELSKKIGKKVSGETMTVLLNPDTKMVDVFKFPSFHKRIVWNSPQAKAGYIGSFEYK